MVGLHGSKAAGKGKRKLPFWAELPILIGVTLVLTLLIKTFLVQAFSIPSGSMENTLQIGDRVLVSKFSYRLGDIKRGDVVVFKAHESWDKGEGLAEPGNPVAKGVRSVARTFGFVQGEKDYIKRVIGLPGDRVVCCDAKGRITVNGKPLDEAKYLFPGNNPSERKFDVVVPEGRLWVMGDHRSASSDSRAHQAGPGGGAIRENSVIGKAFAVAWPASRWKSL